MLLPRLTQSNTSAGKERCSPTSRSTKIQIFVKEGQRLRVLRLGLFEGLHNVIPLLEDCYSTCGTRLLRLSCTAMDESLNAGWTIHVFRRVEGGARAGGSAMAMHAMRGRQVLFTASALLLTPGAPSPTPLQVVLQHMSLWWFLVVVPCGAWWVFSCPWCPPSSLGWCLVPSVRPQPQRAATLLRLPQRLCSLLLRLASSPLLHGKEPVAPLPAPQLLSPSEVDRLRKLVDPPSPPLLQPVEPSNDQPAMEVAAKMQHQEQLKKRVVDAETKVAETKGVGS